MTIRRHCYTWLVLLLMAIPKLACAQAIVPAGGSWTITESFDLANSHDIVLVPYKTVLAAAYDPNEKLGYRKHHFVCRESSADCLSEGVNDNGWGVGSLIPVRLVERRSGIDTDVMLLAHVWPVFEDVPGGNDCHMWSIEVERKVHSFSRGNPCDFIHYPTALKWDIKLPEAELKKLVAGRWSGKFVMDLRGCGPNPDAGTCDNTHVATYEWSFDLVLTDRNHIMVYLPEFGSVAPLLNLDVRLNPSTQELSGERTLQTCIYDGANSQADEMRLTLRGVNEGGIIGRPIGMHSMWRASSSGADERDRLDFNASIELGGVPVQLRNEVTVSIHQISALPVHQAYLPGMPLPVLCVPAPVHFETPPVLISAKNAGAFRGTLQIELSVPASNP